MAQGLLTKDIELSVTIDSTPTDLPDLQEIPDLGGDVDKVEVTVLKDGSRKYINGLKDYGDLAFKFLYGNEDVNDSFRILTGLQEDYEDDPTKEAVEWVVGFPDGTTFTFKGFPSVVVDGAGVGDPITFTLNVALNSDITIVHPTGS